MGPFDDLIVSKIFAFRPGLYVVPMSRSAKEISTSTAAQRCDV